MNSVVVSLVTNVDFFLFSDGRLHDDKVLQSGLSGVRPDPSRTVLIEGAISPASTIGDLQTELTIQIWKVVSLLTVVLFS